MTLDKIYWFINSEFPDQDFFKFGDMKPNDDWCMFDNLLSAYKHAYKMMLEEDEREECLKDWAEELKLNQQDIDECECVECGSKLPENPTEKDYEKIFKNNDYEDHIIEIPIWK